MITPLDIEDLASLNADDWAQGQTWERVRVTLEDAELAGDQGEIREILDILRARGSIVAALDKMIPGTQKLWESLLSRCEFNLIVYLSKEEIDRLLRTRFLTVVRTYPDLRPVIDQQLLTFNYDQSLAPTVGQVMSSMQACQEFIGTQQIVRFDGKKVAPVVEWWIKEYKSTSGGAAAPGALEEASFFIKNPNAKLLSAQDKETLLKILQLLDYFLNPQGSVSPTGHGVAVAFADRDRVPGIPPRLDSSLRGANRVSDLTAQAGAAISQPTPSAASPLPPFAKSGIAMTPIPKQSSNDTMPPMTPLPSTPTTQQYTAAISDVDPSQWVKDIEVILTEHLKEHPDASKKLAQRLWEATAGERAAILPRVLAGVRVLVSLGQGTLVITESPKQSEFRAAGQKGPVLLSRVLKELYQGTWNMVEEEAAQEASHIGSLLSHQGKEEYLEMAYYDMMESRFKWKI